MEPVKVIVENWPKAAPFLLVWAPTIIALVAVIVAICSMRVSIKDTIASHRPYVYAQTFAYLDNTKIITDINTLMKLCINAPAEIFKEEYTYIAIKKDTGGHETSTVLKTEELKKKQLIYPLDPKTNQVTYKTDYDLSPTIADQKVRLLRKVRICYKEISSNRKYFFEGEWEYDRQGKTWKPIILIGN
ncbi:MAG: hypothetical protein ABSA64_06280 [Sedimentisphaerales bacterium]|jgi:hypothetical protein